MRCLESFRIIFQQLIHFIDEDEIDRENTYMSERVFVSTSPSTSTFFSTPISVNVIPNERRI